MTNFLFQKMENLIKKWNELEFTVNSNQNNDNDSSTSLQKDISTLTVSQSATSLAPDVVNLSKDSDSVSNKSQASANVMEKPISVTNSSSLDKFESELVDKKENVLSRIKQELSNALISQELNNEQTEKKEQFRKTCSIDSLKSKTIVTPIQLEINNEEDEDLRKELNIIKVETGEHFANLVTLDQIEPSSFSALDSPNRTFNSQIEKPTVVNKKDSDEEIELINNDLSDWLLWIDHTLESQILTVGDLDEIQQSIKKYSVIILNRKD